MRFGVLCLDVYWQIAQGKTVKVAYGRENVVETEGNLRFVKFDASGMEFEARLLGTRMWVVDGVGNGVAEFNHGELMGVNPRFGYLFA